MSPQPWSPAAGDPREVACDLDITPARNVRQMVRGLLAGHTGIVVDDAVLVVDELVSNAHRHGQGPRACRLALINQDRRLRIEVDDASPQQPRIRRPDRTGGRGLVLVDRLSSAWGVTHHARRKTVWAELALDRPGNSGHAPHLASTQEWHRLT